MADDFKYHVPILVKDAPLKVDKEIQAALRGVVSGKMMSRMKKEAIDCPVISQELPFLRCFACISFVRRFKGEVQCAGGECRLDPIYVSSTD